MGMATKQTQVHNLRDDIVKALQAVGLSTSMDGNTIKTPLDTFEVRPGYAPRPKKQPADRVRPDNYRATLWAVRAQLGEDVTLGRLKSIITKFVNEVRGVLAELDAQESRRITVSQLKLPKAIKWRNQYNYSLARHGETICAEGMLEVTVPLEKAQRIADRIATILAEEGVK